MFTTKVASAAALLVVLGGAAGCGSSDSSSVSSAGPTDADQSSFCATFGSLGGDTKPQEAAAALEKIGTPSDIEAGARHGYELLMSKFETMTGNPDFNTALGDLSAADKADVTSFLTYLTKECPDLLSPSAPAS